MKQSAVPVLEVILVNKFGTNSLIQAGNTHKG